MTLLCMSQTLTPRASIEVVPFPCDQHMCLFLGALKLIQMH